MKKLLLFLLLASLPAMALDYGISVKLNPKGKTISGTETIVWQNTTDTATDILPLHLYMNAFSNNRSIFAVESGGKHRGNRMDVKETKGFGYCKIIKVLVNGENAMDKFRYISDVPDPESLGVFWKDEISKRIRPDKTIGIIRLSKPLEPGETVTLTITFETKFPRVFARTGYWKTFFMGGQWFPKIAVFQGKKGWNCHFFHYRSEFFADFAHYTVALTVPQNYVVGATGYLKTETKQGNTKTLTFSVDNVHDFAWTAWDHWKVATDNWKHVKLFLLYPPGHEGTVHRQLEALKAAFSGYAELCGEDYPYKKFTLVDPPAQASGAGGMEYPMLVTGMFPSILIPSEVRMPEMVIVHEFGHNYFYGMLASNEFEDAWMDEGMNSFGTAYAMDRHYKYDVDFPFLKMDGFDEARMGYGAYKGPDFPGKAAWEFSPAGNGYSNLSYNKPTIYLRTLENMLGKEKFLQIFHTYFTEYKFKHPTPQDFLTVVKETAGDRAEDFVRRMLYTRDKIDFAVTEATSRKTPPFLGLKDFKPIHHDREKEKIKTGYQNTIIVENRGDFQYPVSVEARFKNGSKKMFTWDGKGGWHRFEFNSTSPMTVAIVDPNRIYACDISLKNNAVTLDPRTGSSMNKLALFISQLVQMVFNISSLSI
ncbi:MAG: M1 family metallopeptidase [Acidobacteria bacterium]|nr:M1 family metallopeptidase [Acidobacteriota bacterium]